MNHTHTFYLSFRPCIAAFLGAAALILSTTPGRATLIAEWDFNNYDGSITLLDADAGNGTLEFGSFSPKTASQTGTSLNASTGTAAGDALALSSEANNGGFMTLHLDGPGLGNLVVTYATRRTGTGFNSQSWSYSLDNTTYSEFATLGFSDDGVFETKAVDFSSVAALNLQPNLYFRVTLDGASSASGNNRFDNLQVHAVVPEPKAAGLLSSLLLAGWLVRGWVGRKSEELRKPEEIGS